MHQVVSNTLEEKRHCLHHDASNIAPADERTSQQRTIQDFGLVVAHLSVNEAAGESRCPWAKVECTKAVVILQHASQSLRQINGPFCWYLQQEEGTPQGKARRCRRKGLERARHCASLRRSRYGTGSSLALLPSKTSDARIPRLCRPASRTTRTSKRSPKSLPSSPRSPNRDLDQYKECYYVGHHRCTSLAFVPVSCHPFSHTPHTHGVSVPTKA